MINDQLLGYVKQQLSLKMEKEVIVGNLKSQGWTDADINEVFAAIIPIVAPTPVPISPAVSGVMPKMAEPQSMPVIKSKKTLSVILILILLGLTGGAGIYAYYSDIFISLPDLVSEATDNVRTIKSARYDANFNIDLSGMKYATGGLDSLFSFGVNPKQFNLTAKGSYDLSDSKNAKHSSVISVSLGSLSAEAELKLADGALYAKLVKFPAFPILPISTPSA